MEKLNYIGISASFARAYEIAKTANFKIKFLIEKDTAEIYPALYENALILKRELLNFHDDAVDKALFYEMHAVTFDRVINCRITENLDIINKRIEKAKFIKKPLFDFSNNTNISLLQSGYEKTNMSVKDLIEAIELSEFIAQTESSDAVEPSHVAEALQYKYLAEHTYQKNENNNYLIL